MSITSININIYAIKHIDDKTYAYRIYYTMMYHFYCSQNLTSSSWLFNKCPVPLVLKINKFEFLFSCDFKEKKSLTTVFNIKMWTSDLHIICHHQKKSKWSQQLQMFKLKNHLDYLDKMYKMWLNSEFINL